MNIKGFFSLLIVGVLFGLSASLASMLSDSFSAYESVFIRFGVAAVVAIIAGLFIKNKFSFKNVSKTTLFIFSITFPISVILFVLSVYNTKVVLAIFTYYIADSLISFIIGFSLLGEKPDQKKLVSLFLLMVSLFFFTNILNEFKLDLGMFFGLLSGVVNAIASYYKKIIKGSSSVMNLTILQTISGASMALLAMVLSGQLFVGTINSIDIGISIFYGLVFLIIVYLMIYGFQNFNLNLGSIVVSTELIFGPVFAYFLLNQTMTSSELIGGIIVIIAVLIPNYNLLQLAVSENLKK